jgi:hypothetical protein
VSTRRQHGERPCIGGEFRAPNGHIVDMEEATGNVVIDMTA